MRDGRALDELEIKLGVVLILVSGPDSQKLASGSG
jgi:hypothetical protein